MKISQKHKLFSKNVALDCFIPSGLPRNTLFFTKNDTIKEKVYTYFNIPKDKKIVLFAPTYRGFPGFSSAETIEDSYEKLDYRLLEKNLSTRFGGEWVVLYRGHYYVKDKNSNAEQYIEASLYDDMQELLYAADVLISDYSSAMWDFCLQEKPCFIFAPDIEKYAAERSFYTKPETWPYSIALTNEALSQNILNFDSKEFANKIKKHQKDLNSYENADASKIVLTKTGLIQ